MGWVDRLYGTTVALDSAPLIYYVELHPKYLALLDPFFDAVQRGDLQVITTTLTLTEVLVHPYKRGDLRLANQYSRLLLNSRNLQTLPVTPAIAADAAQIRATNRSKTPDSIQLATARAGNATAFLTNDSHVPALPGIEIIVLDHLFANP
jgi:predicted nucleic acid-binding protein